MLWVPRETNPPSARERQARISALIEASSYVRVSELSETLGVSAVTIRADLEALERRGIVRRVRGGATGGYGLRERPFEEVRSEAAEHKARIAKAALLDLEPGTTLMLDVGTTTAAIAYELLKRDDLHDLTVITSGLTIAMALEPALDRITVVLTGGTLRRLQHSLVPPLADTVLDRVRADVAFVGCNGVDSVAGVTNINLPETEVKRRMIAASGRTVVVADSSKLGVVHLGLVAQLGSVDTLITNTGTLHGQLDDLRANGCGRIVEA
jgi:DeoR family transcriptional regulator of aga operon